MDTNEEKIKDILVNVLNEIQSNSGRTLLEINDDTHPLGDLMGFDSINAVEATTLLSEQLGCDIVPDVALFIKGNRPFTIKEIVINLIDLIKPLKLTHKFLNSTHEEEKS
jgi:acyl carrier protein